MGRVTNKDLKKKKKKMAKELQFSTRSGHSAVILDNYVVVFGGVCVSYKLLSTHVIWTYNLYTNEWRKNEISDKECAPEPFQGAVAVVIDGIVYTFGGLMMEDSTKSETNELWTLCRTRGGSFTWSFMSPHCKDESPSPRQFHTGWEYTRKLWIFGGVGPSPEGYLNDHGDFKGHPMNNQLLCYNPNTHKWTNPECFGSIPSPRFGHANAIIKDQVWLSGGFTMGRSDLGHIF